MDNYKINSAIGKAIIMEYTNGESCTRLGKKYSTTGNTISAFLKRNGITVVNKQNEQPGLNKNIFSNIDTEEKAYWLGFLYADGSVTHPETRYRVEVGLKEMDKLHIEKFKAFLGSNCKVSYRAKTKSYRISVNCKEIHTDLLSLGCVPNKSFVINSIPNIPDDLKIHFIRGFFDGDGCISYGNKTLAGKYSPNINIVSNREMLDAICGYFNQVRHYSKKQKTEVLSLRWSGTKAIEIMKLMYENASVYLERKYERYTIFKQNGFAVRLSDLPKY